MGDVDVRDNLQRLHIVLLWRVGFLSLQMYLDSGEKGVMASSKLGMRVSDHLDLIRGLAAIAVLVYHVRYRFFIDYGDLSSVDPFALFFYAVTSFGHDAVVVFFVLSGYFISTSVIRDNTEGRWSWRRYGVNRCARLYVVLIPGLLLTVFWDVLGLTVYGDNVIYTADTRTWYHDFVPVRDRLDAGTFGANLMFLQTVVSPTLGSNGSLWSLSNEFWYYVFFPIAWIGLMRPIGIGARTWNVLLFSVLLYVVGKPIAMYFPIWLFGTAIFLLPKCRYLKRKWHPIATVAVISVFCSVVAFTHTGVFKSNVTESIVAIDYLTGASFAVALYLLTHDQSASTAGTYRRMSGLLAGFSYTLYVVHMPLLVFARAALVPDEPWMPTVENVCVASIVALATLGYAYFISRVTEARTDAVRSRIACCVGLATKSAHSQSCRSQSEK